MLPDPEWSPHRQEPVAPFKNATSREFRIPPPAGAGGFQFAGIDHAFSAFSILRYPCQRSSVPGSPNFFLTIVRPAGKIITVLGRLAQR